MTAVISDALLGVLGQALTDAIEYRELSARCAENADDQERADSYRGVALVLGIRLGT